MAMQNAQFDEIMRGYEQRRRKNRRIQEERAAEIYTKLPAYRTLKEKVPALSIAYTQRRFSGEGADASALHEELATLQRQMQHLLTSAGYPADYLEPIYDCPDCQDTGYIDSARCHCLKKTIISYNYSASNLAKLISNNNFSLLSEDYYQGEDLALFRRAVEICKDNCRNCSYQNLLFYGTVGTGKSFLSICMADQYLQAGKAVLYFSAAELFDRLSAVTFDDRRASAFSQLKGDLIHADLLIIDDLGTELTNAFTTSKLFSIINERFLHRHNTIISTNLSLEELQNRYSDRIFSRVVSGFTLVKLSGPDIRLAIREHN